MTDNNRQRDRSSNTDSGLERVLFNVQCLFAVRFAVPGNLSDNKVQMNLENVQFL
jgi:hypothetical protein